MLPSTYYQTLNDDYKKLGWPEWVKQQRYSWHGVDYMYHTHISIDELVRTYCETLLAVDESIGEVMDYLKKEGLDKKYTDHLYGRQWIRFRRTWFD